MAVKGILYSLITLLLLTSMMQFNSTILQINLSSIKYIAHFNNTESFFLTVKENILDLKKSVLAKEYVERLVPFDYDYNTSENKIYFETVFPMRSNRLSNFYDILNMHAIFLSSNSDNLSVSASAPKDSIYGGSDSSRFLLTSPCMHYVIYDTNYFDFSSASSFLCDSNFSPSQIDYIVVDLNVKKIDADFNYVYCSPSCYSDSYTSPYYVIRINKDLCETCNFTETIVSKVISPSTSFSVRLCDDTCSDEVQIGVNGYDLNFTRTGDSFVSIGITSVYTEDFGEFIVEDFNLSVESKNLNIKKTNNLLDFYED